MNSAIDATLHIYICFSFATFAFFDVRHLEIFILKDSLKWTNSSINVVYKVLMTKL